VSAERLVDARGMRCPWPVIRLARAAREMADDPIAPGEIAAICGERGWRMSQDESDPHAFEIAIDTAT
jgi:tRNA 2-thiouridine synthesizing protein A